MASAPDSQIPHTGTDNTSQKGGAQQPYYDSPPSYEGRHPTDDHYYGPPPRPRSPMRRFCTAFAFAVLIWVLVTAFIQSMMVVTHFMKQYASSRDDWPSDGDFPIPPELERVRCVWGDEIAEPTQLKASLKQFLKAPLTFPFKLQEKFELPIDSDNLFFFSRGVYSGGKIKIETSHKANDVAKVKVRLEYAKPGSPRIAKVCQFNRKDGGAGIGVFTPEVPEHPFHDLAFFITVKLPKSESSDPLNIRKFETDLPNFTQLLGNLGKRIVFDEVSLKSTNGGIVAGSIVAHRGIVETSNGPITIKEAQFASLDVSSNNGHITGNFNATGSLVLKTRNGKIQGKAFINTDETGLAKLEMATTNGLVESEIFLNHFQKSTDGGKFDVIANSRNAPVKLVFADAPINSTLTLEAKSQNAPVHVLLHPTFEGDFEVSATFSPNVIVKPRVQDPSGLDRHRLVQISREGHVVKGDVAWSDEGKGRGRVELVTTNSPALLVL